MTHSLRLLSVALLCVACGSTAETSVAPEWIELFDGETLDGWTPKFSGHALGVNWRDTFRVEDGNLVVSYEGQDAFDGAFGHLFHEGEYSRFVLRLEAHVADLHGLALAQTEVASGDRDAKPEAESGQSDNARKAPG